MDMFPALLFRIAVYLLKATFRVIEIKLEKLLLSITFLR